jgi:hypothetical protein
MILKTRIYLLLIWAGIFFFLIAPVMAINASWTYSEPKAVLGDVAISSNGNTIAIAAGKILFFSRNGALLSKETFGNNLAMSPDGTSIASSYFSRLYYFHKNLTKNSAAPPPVKKIWETELNSNIRSISLSNTGKSLALSTEGGGVYVYNSNGILTGSNASFASAVRTSSDGKMVVTISQKGVASYNNNGRTLQDFDLSIDTQPKDLVLNSKGTIMYFFVDQMVRAAYPANGTYLWKGRASGNVKAIAATPSGSHVLFSTDNGYLDHFDANGNRTWSFNTNSTNKQKAAVNCVAVSDSGTIVVAGTDDGQIVALDSTGHLQWSNRTNDQIKNIAVSGDGSMIIATSDQTVYAFSKIPISPVGTQASKTPALTDTLSVDTTSVDSSEITPSETLVMETTGVSQVTVKPTQYSVIRTPANSPPSLLVTLAAIFIIIAFVCRRPG